MRTIAISLTVVAVLASIIALFVRLPVPRRVSRWTRRFWTNLAHIERLSILVAIAYYLATTGFRQDAQRATAWALFNEAREGQKSDGIRALVRADVSLTGMHLEGLPLAGLDLWNADLRGAHLQGADLRATASNRSYFPGADFEDCDLEAANLRGADLREVKHLTRRQVESACTGEAAGHVTELPPDLAGVTGANCSRWDGPP